MAIDRIALVSAALIVHVLFACFDTTAQLAVDDPERTAKTSGSRADEGVNPTEKAIDFCLRRTVCSDAPSVST
jgi:hypothetical protein